LNRYRDTAIGLGRPTHGACRKRANSPLGEERWPNVMLARKSETPYNWTRDAGRGTRDAGRGTRDAGRHCARYTTLVRDTRCAESAIAATLQAFQPRSSRKMRNVGDIVCLRAALVKRPDQIFFYGWNSVWREELASENRQIGPHQPNVGCARLTAPWPCSSGSPRCGDDGELPRRPLMPFEIEASSPSVCVRG
jgi:hypothetical protein